MNFPVKKIIAAAVFVLFGLGISSVAPSVEIAWMVGILLLTIYLFAFEILEVDLAAVSILVLLGLTSLPFIQSILGINGGLVDEQKIFTGFSSNAVISIIAVMIIGAGLDKTGLMTRVAQFILKVGGKSETCIIPIVSSTISFVSSFMQNVAAVALFIPVVSRISVRSGLPMSRLLMPMGFTAILGGTVTMVGSSPLILLNDLILSSNEALPVEHQMETWSLFSVTPVGLALVATGILYFVIAGKYVLPKNKTPASGAASAMDHFHKNYNIDYDLFEVTVPKDSSLIGQRLDNIEIAAKICVVAIRPENQGVHVGLNAMDRDATIEANMVLGILTSLENLTAFVEGYHLSLANSINVFSELFSHAQGGMAELMVAPNASINGKSARDQWFRKTHGMEIVAYHRNGKTLGEGESIRDITIQTGDTLVIYTAWVDLARIEQNKDFLIASDYPSQEEVRANKLYWAGIWFTTALTLVLFTDVRLSIALLTGAVGMILSGVIKIDEAYKAVSWKTVFLLASLIPLGLAVELSGTANWIAKETVGVVGDMPIWVIQTAIAILATGFTLVMSNVGAAVLLVPLAANIAIQVGASPAVFALTVAITTSNSFLIPTHHVNALIMGLGGYRVADFIRIGSVMTVLFLVVMLTVMNLIF